MTHAAAPASAIDLRFMRRALALAEHGLGETNPNPPVGCVLVRNGRVVGEGFHARAGSPHAEALALDAAGPKARGATAYITLEPCAPKPGKRTPPCAPRLIASEVSRVVFGARDLHPGVRGTGAKLLRAAGIHVTEGVLGPESLRLVQHFNTAWRQGRPFVTLKAGMTLDGRIATVTGESQWITSKSQRRAARRLRRLYDGVLVGIETALKDDPILLPEPALLRPFTRIVLDSRLRLQASSRLVKSAGRHPLIVVCGPVPAARRAALEDHGVIVITTRAPAGRVSIPETLVALFARGIVSIMVEGGSEVLGSFVRSRSFEDFVIFRAPLILGGRGSRAVVAGENPGALSDALPMRRAAVETSATLYYGLTESTDLDVEVYEPRTGSGIQPHLPRKGR